MNPENVLREKLLAERAAALARPIEQTELPDASGMLLQFSAGGSSYALPLNEVAEVLPQATPSPVPGAPSVVAGVIQLRGEIVPVYRLNELFGAFSAVETQGALLILAPGSGRQRIGILASEIGEIVEAAPGGYSPLPGDSRFPAKLFGEKTVVLGAAELLNTLAAKKEGS